MRETSWKCQGCGYVMTFDRIVPSPTVPASDLQRALSERDEARAQAAVMCAELTEMLVSEIPDSDARDAPTTPYCFGCETGAENGALAHQSYCVLSSSSGAGWLSPEEAERLRAEAAEMRRALDALWNRGAEANVAALVSAALSSSAGAALLEEMEGLRREVRALEARESQHRERAKTAEAVSADLRRERDGFREEAGTLLTVMEEHAHCHLAVSCLFCDWREQTASPEARCEAMLRHVSECSAHPMRRLEAEAAELRARVAKLRDATERMAKELAPNWSRWIGPCVHGSDPWTRCDVCEEAGEAQSIVWVLDAERKAHGAEAAELRARLERVEEERDALLAAEEAAKEAFGVVVADLESARKRLASAERTIQHFPSCAAEVRRAVEEAAQVVEEFAAGYPADVCGTLHLAARAIRARGKE